MDREYLLIAAAALRGLGGAIMNALSARVAHNVSRKCSRRDKFPQELPIEGRHA